ncbi:MAG: hypothetical protein ISS93_01520 [Candidatus Aenigmarchaeota archaeon]|nr:hypothetical protein [Candidatus Aenigmarchaeota archaeon]
MTNNVGLYVMNDVYGWVKSDLKTLKKWSRTLISKLPPAGSMISGELYLQNNTIQIEIISQLEYFLKTKGKIKSREQFKIVDIIKNSSSLQDLEKDHLILLFFVRHTICHNGGHYDKEFINNCEKHLKKLKIERVKEGLLSSLPPDELLLYIDLTGKLIDEINNNP